MQSLQTETKISITIILTNKVHINRLESSKGRVTLTPLGNRHNVIVPQQALQPQVHQIILFGDDAVEKDQMSMMH
jgi:hypothetical protein